MAEQMKAARLHGVGDVRVERVPRPTPGDGEVLLAVRAVSLCGSDRHYYLEGGIGSSDLRGPIIPGHEFAAEVADEGARAHGLEPGSLVAVDPAQPCGRCEWCIHGHANLCPYVRFAGSPPDQQGALAEYAVASPERLFPLPPEISPAQGALLEPLGVAIHALDLARVHAMDTVLVLGAGAIGLLMVQVAFLEGAGEVYVVDPVEQRTAVAQQLGATATADTPGPVAEWTRGRGVDVVLEAADSEEAPTAAVETARIGGRVILAGIPSTDRVVLRAATLRRKGLTLKAVRRMKHTYPRAIRMVCSGRVRLSPLITHTFPLERAAEAFACHAERRDGVIRPVVEIPGSS